MSKNVLLDLSFLTEEERDIISNVISKDAKIREQEQSRISSLRKELDTLKENGLPSDEIESKNENYCARCQAYFGSIFNRGAYCPRCELKVCKVCRVNDVEDGWICTLCHKMREVKAQSGAWFFQGHKEKTGNLFGSVLVRQSLRRLPGSYSTAQKDNKVQSRFVSPREYPEKQNPVTGAVNLAKSSERLSAQNNLNSNQPQRNGDNKMGYQYSDDSDSEQGDDDDDLEHFDTASDNTASRDTAAPSAQDKEEIGNNPFFEDSEKSDSEEASPNTEVRPDEEIPETNQDIQPKSDELEPYDADIVLSEGRNMEQPAEEKEPESIDSREDALRAFSETFVSVNVGTKKDVPYEDQDTFQDADSNAEMKLDLEETRGYRGSHEDHEPLEYRGTREDRGHFEGQGTLEGQGSREYRELFEDHADSEGIDSRRSSELQGFQADTLSTISETSGYGTPSVSEDISSKRTTSISGDEGRSTPTDQARGPPSESAPVIVTTEAAVDNDAENNNRNSSITDYDEDLDVSFSKFGGGLGNRMLKDQLSMGSRESIASYYSNAGGEVYGKYPVSGEILFGIKYDPKIQEFQIQIHQAREITAVDKKTKTSDPYIKTYLLPDRSRSGKRKSKVKKNTVDPVFDEILTYKISYDEILQRTLWVAVWNHDTFGHNDFLGEVLVPIDEYHQSGFSLEDPEPQWYELCERQADNAQFSYNGEIVFALKYVPPSALVSSKKKKKKKKGEEKGELHVNIIEASNLMAKDSNGFSDPFCKSYLLPDKSKKTKQKTAVVKKTLNPKWNYHFVYENVTHEELMDRVLELTVWDFDRGSSNEFLGGVRLGLGARIQEWDDATSEEQAAWNKMLNNQNDWNQVSLVLREHMGSHKSSGYLSNAGLDPSLMDIIPTRPPSDAFFLGGSPDHQLIRHHEYHSPRETKIAAKTRLSQNQQATSPVDKPFGSKKLTLAELARSQPKQALSTSESPRSFSESPDTPSSATHESVIPKSPPEIVTEELASSVTDSMIRHSEFYKGSISVMRRPSSDSQQSVPQRRGSTLSELVQQEKKQEESADNDSLLGSNLRLNEELMGSRESIYSNDGVYGNYDISGELLLQYQYDKGHFKLKIYQARGLTAVDKSQNTSNPYVKVYLLPDQSRAGKRKTKTKFATLDPEFDEEMQYKICIAELTRRTVWISLWHYDRFGRNEFLGEIRIPLSTFQGSEVTANWYQLLPLQSSSIENDQGEIVIALMYSPADKKRRSGQGAGKLYVKIVEARNLPGKDADGLSDPFCKSYLLPDPQKKSKRKSPVKKKNLNPRWDYKFSYDNLTIDELQSRVLELTVWDHDLGTSNDFLGGVRIGLGTSDESWDDCTGEEVTLWQFLLSKPNTWAESTLRLRSEMGSRKGLTI